MRTLSSMLALALLCVLSSACGDNHEELDQALLFLETPVALDDQVVLVDKTGPSAFVLDVGDGKLDASTTRYALPPEPSIVLRRNQANEALILCLGRRATREHAEEQAALVVLSGSGQLRRYTLADPFDSLVQSEDGRYVFLFKTGNAGRLLQNPNEIGLVNLSLEPKVDGAVTLQELRSFGDSPAGVVFSPTMSILNEPRRLAVVLSRTSVTLIDLAHRDRQETTVQLSTTGGTAVQPVQVLFGLDEPRLYVRGTSSNDVFAFNLIARPEGEVDPSDDRPHNDFRPFIDQLGVGGPPSDLVLYRDQDRRQLLALNAASNQIALVDPDTSQVTSVALTAPASQLLLFDATSPHGAEVQKRALLYRIGTASITFLDLLDLDTRRGQNLETLNLERPIAKLIPLLDENIAVAVHDQGGVSLIDLADRTISPIRSDVPLKDALFDSHERKLWVGPATTDRIGFLDLKNGATGEVLLDAPIGNLVPMFARERIVVLHPSSVGYATVVSATDPSRDTARSVRGFLIADLLERGR